MSRSSEAVKAEGPVIAGVGTALPPHVASQAELTAALRRVWAKTHFNPARLDDLHAAVGVSSRHLALPLEAYEAIDSFQKSNAAYNEIAPALAEEAVRKALAKAGAEPSELRHLFFVTVTGIATPSLDARLMNRLGLRPDVKRTPIFGLGCVAGAAGLARASDVLRAYPEQTAALVSVELCSLTMQRSDLSIPNMIASGLFGDGAAAVVLRGGRAPAKESVTGGPRIRATRSVFYPQTEQIMGWDIRDTGFKVVLSSKVPELARAHIGRDVDAFLEEQGLSRDRIRHWVAHTGGPKVLEAFQGALGLSSEALARSWESLRSVGNLSSASVLFVLSELLASDDPKPGDLGVLLAMGPGFCAELVLLEW